MVDLSNQSAFQTALDNATRCLDGQAPALGTTTDSAALLSLAIESAGSGAWEVDAVEGRLWLNFASRRLIGLPESHSGLLSSAEWAALIDDPDVPSGDHWPTPIEPLTGLKSREFRIRRPSGETTLLSAVGHSLYGASGRVERMVGLLFDQTTRSRAEVSMRDDRQEWVSLAQQAALIGTFTMGPGRKAVGTPQFFRNLGYAGDTPALDRDDFLDLIHPEDRPRVETQFIAAAATPSTDVHRVEYRIRRADTGEIRWILSRLKFARDGQGRSIRTFGAHVDITDTKRAEAALQQAVALNHRILEATVDCVLLIGLDGRLQMVNKRGMAALEVADETTLLGRAWVETLPRSGRPQAQAALDAARQGQTGRFNTGCPTTTGKPKWWDVVVTPICDELGEPTQLLAISRDVTEHRNHLNKLRWAATHDMLTELPNRRYFQERLQKVLTQAAGDGTHASLLHLDIDDFKLVNDTLGHQGGDALLKTIADRLRLCLRAGEMAARLGGDEFAIIVPSLSGTNDTAGVIDRIREAVAEPFVCRGRIFDCKVSIGEALFPDHGTTVDELLKNSDLALYFAKTEGRGRMQRFEPSMGTEMQSRAKMVNRARTALKYDRVFPFYQPKIDFRTGAAAGFEALLRWQGPDGIVQLPAAIAAAFVDLDVAQALSERMQARIFADIRRWLDAGIDFGHVALNASVAEFRQNDFGERLLERLRNAGVPTECIELEVTETVFLGRGSESVEHALNTLHDHGIRIALDDFGTGYASLSHLKQFPVDIIKIDQSFVRDMDVDAEYTTIIKALIGLGKSLSIDIVAEGIETRTQAACLAELGCDYGQGYLFGKAVPADEVPAMIDSLRPSPQPRRHAR